MNPPRAEPRPRRTRRADRPERLGAVASARADDKPLALFANYSLHYVGDMPALSADYFGVFAEVIGQKLKAGPGFVGILSNGTSGDVNNINFKEAGDEDHAGRAVAARRRRRSPTRR